MQFTNIVLFIVLMIMFQTTHAYIYNAQAANSSFDPTSWLSKGSVHYYTILTILPALTGRKECTPTLFPASVTRESRG